MVFGFPSSVFEPPLSLNDFRIPEQASNKSIRLTCRQSGHSALQCIAGIWIPTVHYINKINCYFQAVGSEGEILPGHVGMPLGEGFGGATYFMLETHYDNPAYHKDLVDTSGRDQTFSCVVIHN